MRPNRFYDVIQIGPVKVGTYNNGRGQTRHTAACTAPKCGFSTEIAREELPAQLANERNC
ncbi:mobile element transfer protein [Streptomyces sp. NPDC002573]|uniref:mobile element transfer protein n=1 Tax=Streptomyces sp. NPDC002573 TaxID=3364651 RepID=UPI00367DE98E